MPGPTLVEEHDVRVLRKALHILKVALLSKHVDPRGPRPARQEKIGGAGSGWLVGIR